MDNRDTENLDSLVKEIEGVLVKTKPASEIENIDNADKLSFSNQAKRKECLENDALEQDIQARRDLTKRVFVFIEKWFFFLGALLVFNNWLSINASDSVLIALLTTTSINVIGLAAIVARGYFSKK